MEQTGSSKKTVLDFWRLAIGQRDLSFAERIISDHYIQHSATVNDGKKAILASLEALAKMPKPASDIKPFMRVIADQQFVAVHMLLETSGRKFAVLDLIRVEDGLLTEHWDAVQIIPDDVGNFMVHGPVVTENSNNQNKVPVAMYVQDVLIDRKTETATVYFADNFVEHDPLNCLQKCSYERLHRVIAEGDLILTQMTGTIGSKPCVLYDIFRVSGEKIAEHWNVHQLIPEKMPHGNKIV